MPLDLYVKKTGIELDDLSEDSWVISSKAEYEIKKQIEKVGTPLKDWDIAINYGIKTGFNEAFIIDGEKKDELIAADPKSAEIIKPVLRGRDIKRYRVDFADLWLINTHNGYGKIASLDVSKYPDIIAHIDNIEKKRLAGEFGEKARKARGLHSRVDQGITPYNLRSCAYLDDFDGEKIAWGNLALSCQFALADEELYINNPSPFINSGDRYLLAVLNSTVADYYIRSLGVTRSGGYFEYKPMFVEKLPVPYIPNNRQKPFQILANYVLLATKNEQKLQSAYFEQLIDGLVYELYFPDEIKAANKEILPHLGELPPLTDDMAEEEKLATIQREFDRLYDPRHPVRNNLETLDSVEMVRTIREALKK